MTIDIETIASELRKMGSSPVAARSAQAILDLLERNPLDRKKVDLKTLSFFSHIADSAPDRFEREGDPDQYGKAEDWSQMPDGPRGGKRWRHKSGRIQYGTSNPGGGGGGGKQAAAPKAGEATPKAAPAAGPKATSKPKSSAAPKAQKGEDLAGLFAPESGAPKAAAQSAAQPSQDAGSKALKAMAEHAKTAASDPKLAASIAQERDVTTKGQELARQYLSDPVIQKAPLEFGDSVEQAAELFGGGFRRLESQYGYAGALAIGCAAIIGGTAGLAAIAIGGGVSAGVTLGVGAVVAPKLTGILYSLGAMAAAAPVVALAKTLQGMKAVAVGAKNMVTGGSKQYAMEDEPDHDAGDAQPSEGEPLTQDQIAEIGLQFWADMMAEIAGKGKGGKDEDAGDSEPAEQYARYWNDSLAAGLGISVAEDMVQARLAIADTGYSLNYAAHEWQAVRGDGAILVDGVPHPVMVG